MIVLRRASVTFAAIGALVTLAGCAAILGLEPTDVENGDGGIATSDDGGRDEAATGDGGTSTNDGGHIGGGDAPPINPNCGSAIRSMDANGETAPAIVADANGVFWAITQDSSSSLILSNATGENVVVVGSDDGNNQNDQPTVIGLALDSERLYWSAWDTYSAGPQAAHVRAMPRGGGMIIEPNLSDAGVGVGEVVLAHGSLWWGNWKTLNGHIYSLAVPFVSGANPIDQSGGVLSPLHFSGNDSFVFYDESSVSPTSPQDEVGVASTTLGNPTEIAVGLHGVADLAAGPDKVVYWAETTANKISWSPGDAGAQKLAVVSYPHFVAYDGDHQLLYVVSSSTSDVWSVQRISLTAAEPAAEMCVDDLEDVSALAYFGGHLYFSAVSKSGSALFDMTTN